jgi:hypothetical protein
MVDKRQYAERRSGELLPRHASAYIPPHRIPAQPDARTMENRTVRVAPELDPRLAMTQVSMQRVREQRRSYWGIVGAAALGSLLAVGVYSLLPRDLLSSGDLFGQNPAPVANAQAGAVGFNLAGVNRLAGGAQGVSTSSSTVAGSTAASSAAASAQVALSQSALRPGAVAVPSEAIPAVDSLPETGIVEEITDPAALPRSTSRPTSRASRPRSSVQSKSSRGSSGDSTAAARGHKKGSNPDPAAAEDSADETKVEGSKVWLE